MVDIRNVRQTGDLMVVRFVDDSQLSLYPSGLALWTAPGAPVTPPPPDPEDPPPPPDPEDPTDPPPDPTDPTPTPTGKWVHPLPNGTVTSGYGESRGAYLHVGIDVSDVGGTGMGGAILATTDLKITVAKEDGTGGLPDAGTYVKGHTISGTQYSFSHFHGHPGTLAVSVGQIVTAGTKLMNAGNSGNSYGTHLHLEIWNGHMPGDFFYWGDGTPPDPLPILRANGIQI